MCPLRLPSIWAHVSSSEQESTYHKLLQGIWLGFTRHEANSLGSTERRSCKREVSSEAWSVSDGR